MPSRRLLVIVLFGLSGIAGLGYQIAWTRMFAVGLGHEMSGLLAVVTAFFVGLAVGGIALDRVVSRSHVPGRWFAGLELLIGVWGVAVALLAPWINDVAARLIGADPSFARQWTVAFALPLVVLLPSTAAMGGTLPAIERLSARLAGRGTTVAGLYAANTLGAMLGIVLTATIVIPAIGLRGTVFVLAAVNVLCGAAMWLGPAAGERRRAPVVHAFEDPPRPAALAALLFATGLLGIGFEVAGVRVLAQVLENTIYTYASTVAIFLLGTALGAAAWQRFGTTQRFAAPAAWLLTGLGLGVVVGLATLPATRSVYDAVRGLAAGPDGRGATSILGELTVAALVFGPATVAMGATFSHLVLAARRATGGVGLAAGLNTLGGAVAPPLVGVLLIPLIGSRWTLSLLAVAYVLLLPLVPRTGLRLVHLVPVALIFMGVIGGPSDLVLIRPPSGMRFIAGGLHEGVMATVGVAEDDRGRRLIKVNDRFSMGGTKYSFADRRQGHLPMLLHPHPRSALFLGVGSGLTAGAATLHGDARVTMVELVPEVVDVLPLFAPENRLENVEHVVVADARRFVRADDRTYDVIVADLFHPARDGAGGLYTREHFAAVRERLAEGGLFCQWLPLHQLDAPVVRMIARTFLDVFPEGTAWIASYNVQAPLLAFVARRDPGPPPAGHPWTFGGTPGDASWLAAVSRERGPALTEELGELALTRPLDLVGCHLMGPAALCAYAGEGPLNRDDLPHVVFDAPWYTYATQESGLTRMEELLAVPLPERSAAGGVLGALPGADETRAFVSARDEYMLGCVATLRGDAVPGRDLLLRAVGTSRDFNTAYLLAVQEAGALARGGDVAGARVMLQRLVQLRPDRREARILLSRIGSS